MKKRIILIAGLILGLLLFWLLNTPKALSAGVCTCAGDVSVNWVGKAAAKAGSVDLASVCNSNGGKFDGSTCSGLKKQVSASSKGECEGYNEDTLMSKFNIPSVVSTMGSLNIKCIWEESPELSPGKNATGTTAGGGGANVGTGGPAASAGCPKDAKDTICLENPLEGSTDMLAVFGTIVKAALGIIGSLTLLMLVWGGFQWVTSAGNDEKVKKGSQTMIWAAIGAFLALASYLIMTTFLDYLAGMP